MARTTSMSFVSCLMICSSVSGSPLHVMVMREKAALVASALTTRLSMLYPRRENTSAMRTRTPGLLRTRIEIVLSGAEGAAAGAEIGLTAAVDVDIG